MDANLKQMLTKLASFWENAAVRTKVLIIGGFAAALLIIILLSTLLSSTQYSLLFSGLSDSESGQIVTELKTMGVKYRLDASSIYVDQTKADETRMLLAEDGYPQTTLTYSTYLSGNNWAETDSQETQMVLYQLQDRLQQTINTIPGVSSNVVTIVENQDDTYVLSTDKINATASVKLNLNHGLTLSQKQVNGIVQLVSHSVPDLSSDNVTVLDSDGAQLNQTGDDTGNSSSQLDLKNTIENEIRQKVLSVLTPVFGSANVQVAAGATLDFSQKTTDTTTYTSPNSSTPGVGVPSSQSNTTTTDGGTDTASGITGVNSGQSASTTSSTTSNSSVTQSSQQTNYLYNVVNQQIQSQGGTMTGLTIAVLLNNKSQSAAGVNAQDVRQTVAFAVGLTDTAGISVQMIPFLAQESSTVPAKPSNSPLNLLTIEVSAGVLVIAVIFFILLTILSGGRRRKKNAAVQPAVSELSHSRNENFKTPFKSIEETIEETSDKNSMRKQIVDFADNKPELVAQLLKNWLKD